MRDQARRGSYPPRRGVLGYKPAQPAKIAQGRVAAGHAPPRRVSCAGMDDGVSPFPRSLTNREAGTLEFMLSAGLPGSEALREQAARAVVIDQCTCGCATIDFGLDDADPAAAELQGAPLIQTRARDMDAHPVSLMLFVRDGRLASLEIVWYDESQMTDEFPEPAVWEPPTAAGAGAGAGQQADSAR